MSSLCTRVFHKALVLLVMSRYSDSGGRVVLFEAF